MPDRVPYRGWLKFLLESVDPRRPQESDRARLLEWAERIEYEQTDIVLSGGVERGERLSENRALGSAVTSSDRMIRADCRVCGEAK